MGPFFQDDPGSEKGALFLHLNTNKKSVTLNLQTSAGRDIFKALVQHADAVVENFSPGTMERLGFSYEVLEQINPRIVMTSISNFGQSGPYRDFKGTELMLFGMSGGMIQEGARDREPLKYAGYQAQYFSGAHAAAATMTALTGCRLHGVAQHVDTSIFEAVRSIPELETARYGYTGPQPESVVARRPYYYTTGSFPSGVYSCKDGYVVFFANQRHFKKVCTMIERPELASDPRFSTREALQRNSDDFLVEFINWLSDKPARKIVDIAQSLRIPAAPTNRINELFEEPQLKARNYFVNVDHPVVGRQTYPGAPFRLPESPWAVNSPAPLLGQHNEEVYLGALGLSKSDLVVLAEQGVI